jgi:hypothetical protein
VVKEEEVLPTEAMEFNNQAQDQDLNPPEGKGINLKIGGQFIGLQKDFNCLFYKEPTHFST